MKETIEYNGQTYTRVRGKWYDKNHMAVPHLQKTLDELYALRRSLDDLTPDELIAEGDRFKEAGSFHIAVRYFERALEATQDVQKYRSVLPRLTSCCRSLGRPEDALALYDRLTAQYGKRLASPALLTSVGAAYCDIGEYEKAYEFAKRAYAMGKGKASPELQALFARIRKLTTGSGKYEE